MNRERLSLITMFAALVLTASLVDGNDRDHSDLSASQAAAVTGSIHEFMAAVARDITAEGPRAWRKYLSQKPAFLMASNGQLVFESGDAAAKGIGSLEQTIERIELKWGDPLHVDPLSATLAQVGVPFHEVLTQKTGERVSVDGYFTGLAERGVVGWQFRSAHWSVPPSATASK
jgi:hypothetical protein